ncbi:MAG: hypothetical protein B7Y43_14450 [Sphingomonas sp. 28-62-20]|uniref:SCP2 sterol-binding domain-containing protein n=1 Tax=unclassified Sphingomonas TaxID=196159 RepID=UPI000A8B1CEB|nr:SCP2 sterol-binding domain-containing protein [Sphingomonas sp.]OYY76721.1 MAG: hypothetical protein B7Y43_14450 [Sphingomonas sp. 28-62-20]
MAELGDITAIMAANEAFVPGRRIKFDFGDAGVILLDGVAAAVTNEDAAAETTLKMSLDNFKLLAKGKLNPTMAFMTGKIKLEGDMGLAMQLQAVTAKIKL